MDAPARPLSRPSFAQPATVAPAPIGPELPSGSYRLEINWPANAIASGSRAFWVSQPVTVARSNTSVQLTATAAGWDAHPVIMLGGVSASGTLHLSSGSVLAPVDLTGPVRGAYVTAGDLVYTPRAVPGPAQHVPFTLKPDSEPASPAPAGVAAITLNELARTLDCFGRTSC